MKSLGLFAILLLFVGSALAKEATAQIKVSDLRCMRRKRQTGLGEDKRRQEC